MSFKKTYSFIRYSPLAIRHWLSNKHHQIYSEAVTPQQIHYPFQHCLDHYSCFENWV